MRRSGDTVVVETPEELAFPNRNDLRQLVLDIIHDTVSPVVVIDLNRTEHVDSAGLGTLVTLRKKATQRGGELWIANVNADVKQRLSLTKVELVLPCLDDIDEDDDGAAGRTAPRPPRMPGPLSGSAEADWPPPADLH